LKDGSLIDEYRGEERDLYRVSYPLYHLQGLAVLSQLLMLRGENEFLRENSRGASQLTAWNHYIPYVNGELPFAWQNEESRIHYGVSKYTWAVAAYRDEGMFAALSAFEPLWEPHLMKKAASLVGRIPVSLLGRDVEPPRPPRDVRLSGALSTSLTLSWEEGAVEDEGDLVLHYLVYRNGALLAKTTERGFVDRDLEPETGYRYEVRAVDRSLNQSEGVDRLYYTKALP
jgi:hypothetical protein